MKLCLAFLLACAALAGAAETARDAKIVAALAQAEKFAAAEKWREALAAGNRLRTLTRALHGEDHADSALAELFLGEARDHLGERGLAESHFRRALAIQEKVLRPDAPELVTTLTRLGACLKERQSYAEAAGLLQRALDLQTKIGGPDNAGTAAAGRNLARIHRLQRDYGRALPLLERAVAIQRRTLGGTDPETLEGLHELAQLHELAGDFAAAELTTAERVAGAEAQFGPRSVELAAALSDWGRFAERLGHFAEAEPRFRRALTICELRFDDNDLTLAASRTQLGWCLRNLDRYDDAQPHLQRALDARLRSLGPDHLDTAWSSRNLGWIHRLKRDFEAARPLFESALAIRRKSLGEGDPLTIESLSELGDLHWLRGAYDEAAALLETRRYRVEEAFGPASEETAAAWHGLAIVYESAKRWSEATQAALRSLKLTEERLGPASAQTLGEIVLLSRICQAAGAFDPALTQYQRLAAWFSQHPEADGKIRAELLRQFAVTTFRAGRTDAAGPLFREARRVHELAFGAADPATLRSIGDLWTYYEGARQSTLALEAARELAARTEAALGADAPATAAVFDRVGQFCLTLGERAEAMRWFRRLLGGQRRRFGDNSAEVIESLALIAGWFEERRDFRTATELRTERLGAMQRKFGLGSMPVAEACGDLAQCYFRQRDLVAARGMFEQQLALIEKQPNPDRVAALTAVARIGDVAMAARDWPAAVKSRERLAEGCSRQFGAEHVEHARALLLLGEALLASGDARAEGAVRTAHPLLQAAGAAQASVAARAAAALARTALRRGDAAEARRWTRDALATSFEHEEPLAEAFSLLGEDLARAADDPSSESAFTGALMILTQVAGDHDEHTFALLERLAILRLRLGRPLAVALLERALAASEAIHGATADATARVLGWLALARVGEGQFAAARSAAQRMLDAVRQTAGEGDPRVPLARDVEAWTGLHAADRDTWDAAMGTLTGRMLERWNWMPAVTGCVTGALSAARERCVGESVPPRNTSARRDDSDHQR